jgi:hypothetical protein
LAKQLKQEALQQMLRKQALTVPPDKKRGKKESTMDEILQDKFSSDWVRVSVYKIMFPYHRKDSQQSMD